MTTQDEPSGILEASQLPNLGKLEARTLEVVWSLGRWSNTREVMEVLGRDRKLAYTTVMTILVKLWKKDLLERKKDGRAFVYRAVLSREEWTARRMGELLNVAENHAEALSHFVSSIGTSDLSQLRRILRSDD